MKPQIKPTTHDHMQAFIKKKKSKTTNPKDLQIT